MRSATVATRLPEALLKEVQRFARRRRLGPSQALAYAAEHPDVDAWVDENDRLGEELEREYLARARA